MSNISGDLPVMIQPKSSLACWSHFDEKTITLLWKIWRIQSLQSRESYLMWRFDIHVYSTKVSMHNVFTVKVVTNRRDLRQKHHYVLLLTLSSKNVLFESAIRTVGTRDLTNRWSGVMIFPMVTWRKSEKIRLLLCLSDNWLGCFTVHAHINFGGRLE